MNLSKFRIPLLALILGAALVVLGLVFKSMQLGWGLMQANTLVMLGGIIEAIAAIMALVVLIRIKK